jgi:hypothetical protein
MEFCGLVEGEEGEDEREAEQAAGGKQEQRGDHCREIRLSAEVEELDEAGFAAEALVERPVDPLGQGVGDCEPYNDERRPVRELGAEFSVDSSKRDSSFNRL